MKKFIKVLFNLLIPIAVGVMVGMFGVRFVVTTGEAVGEYENTFNLFNVLLRLVVPFVSLFIAFYFHIIIHEAGHLIAGKLSGYKLVLFGVGNMAIIRDEGKLVCKKYGIVGAAGQCLMSPPEVADTQYKYPFIFYNLGGGLANILFSILFVIISFLTSGNISMVFFVLSFVGILLGLINIIPLKLNGIANDGLNILACCKRLESRRALWIQLKFVALVTQGVRLCDMPQEWVENVGTPTDALIGFLAVLRCSYHLDKGEIEQASDYAKSVIKSPGKMLELHKNELQCELLFCNLIRGCQAEEVEKLYTAELCKHIKALATHLSKHRLMYAYERLYLKDEAKANKTLEIFEKSCLQTPFRGEIAGERELIELVKRKCRGVYT